MDDMRKRLVEAMARAAYEILPVLEGYKREPWEHLSAAVQARYRMEQKAALTALQSFMERENLKMLSEHASRQMADAWSTVDPSDFGGDAYDDWRAMFDAAPPVPWATEGGRDGGE
jgi:hypothetical protein